MIQFKRYLPTSLFWRAVLIVVAPIVILQGVVASLIIQRHFDGATRQMSETVASEIRYLFDVADTAPDPATAKDNLSAAAEALGYDVALIIGATIPPNSAPLFFDVIAVAVEETLRRNVDRPLYVTLDREEKHVDVRGQTTFGVLQAVVPRRRVVAQNPHLLLTWTAAAAAALIFVSVLYLRNQIRPVSALAEAADAFGKGRSEPIKISGASEVRLAARAFLDMRERIERQMEQRTRMLSGVSHDMRTPLTRMKLTLEMMDETDDAREMRRDVADLEHILEEFLAYARGDHGEAFENVDVAELVREVALDVRRGGRTLRLFEEVETPGDGALTMRRHAVKRCLHNLLENAYVFGDRVELSLRLTKDAAEIAVEDDGPGIPAASREEAFRPFNRLDDARNQDRSGGVGLGLALALDTARSHGGDVTLDDGPRLGGLRATLRLPR